MTPPTRRFLPALAVAVALAFAPAASHGELPYYDLPDLGEAADSALSAADEARIGRNVVAAMRAGGEIADDAEVTLYLNDLGGRLAQPALSAGTRYQFFVVNDRSINAFALPGGYIGVNSGLLLASQSEAELASVLAHEIAHVAQRHMARMKAASAPNQLVMLAAILAGALAARSGSADATIGVLNAGIGLSIQNQLSYSRDFEREADRLGMQYLAAAGFDVRAMPSFFERMQQANRHNDNNAYAFLRTHPVTVERISEAQNRALGLPLKMRADSVDYLLAREKLRVAVAGADEAARFGEAALRNRQFLNEGATWFGLASARLAQRRVGEAAAALREAQARLPAHPMLATLSAAIARASGDAAAARAAFRAGRAAFPGNRALTLAEIDFLLEAGDRDAAGARLREALSRHNTDAELYRLQARLYADRDRLRYHAALGNAFYFEMRYGAAMEQYQLAGKAPGDDFYLRSAIEARMREIEKTLKEDGTTRGKKPADARFGDVHRHFASR
ncbi:putative Zn-dependent protease [Crenobacter luteus]|uniref:M48 family metallopeptidase n=1 Tax=Crenobacter luteus TaxID=1452487 RepID=UPI001048BD3C|nr:M48 family metalloprotease [Crenobacter luteus]TCP13657.1 putative Zn-dependent protease [Crenobacter luteus]